MTMMILLKRKLSRFLPNLHCDSTFFVPAFSFRGFSTAKTQISSPNSSYIVQYLVGNCGFSSDEAIKASRDLTHIKSSSRPDSVIQFLKDTGLNDAQIRTLVSKRPSTLCASVERTLAPRIKALREMGFSESELVQLVEIPNSLRTGDLQAKILFLKTLFGNNKDLLKAVRRNNDLLQASLHKTIMPCLSLLKGAGIPDYRIVKLVSQTQFINRSNIKASIERAEELGFSRGSCMFGQAVQTLLSASRSTVIAKLGVLRSLGWSEAEVSCAIKKQPALLSLSEKKIRAAMRFLTKEAGCELSYVASRPPLLSYSLERRLAPRFYVTRVLKREQLIRREYDLFNVVNSKEDKFIKKFILPYEVKLPGLREAYVAACNGDVPDKWKA